MNDAANAFIITFIVVVGHIMNTRDEFRLAEGIRRVHLGGPFVLQSAAFLLLDLVLEGGPKTLLAVICMPERRLVVFSDGIALEANIAR